MVVGDHGRSDHSALPAGVGLKERSASRLLPQPEAVPAALSLHYPCAPST